MVLVVRLPEHKVAQRKKGQKRHIVGDEHGADEGDVHQRHHRRAQIPETADDILGQGVEESDIAQRLDHRQRTEQAGQGAEVKIAQVFSVRRDDERRHHRGNQRDDKHQIHRDEFTQFSKEDHTADVRLLSRFFLIPNNSV